MARRLFMAENEGWMGFGFLPVKVWETSSIRLFSSVAPNNTTKFDEKKYRGCIRNCKGSPSTRAGIALYLSSDKPQLAKHLYPFKGNWKEEKQVTEKPHNFHSAMVTTAVACSNFMVSMLEFWDSWCEARGIERNEENFLKFAYDVLPDMDMAKDIMHYMYIFSTSFPSIYSPYWSDELFDDLELN